MEGDVRSAQLATAARRIGRNAEVFCGGAMRMKIMSDEELRRDFKPGDHVWFIKGHVVANEAQTIKMARRRMKDLGISHRASSFREALEEIAGIKKRS